MQHCDLNVFVFWEFRQPNIFRMSEILAKVTDKINNKVNELVQEIAPPPPGHSSYGYTLNGVPIHYGKNILDCSRIEDSLKGGIVIGLIGYAIHDLLSETKRTRTTKLIDFLSLTAVGTFGLHFRQVYIAIGYSFRG